MAKDIKISIIIPLYKITPYFYEAVEKCLELNYKNFEILIGVDKDIKLKFNDKRIKVLRTGLKRTGPAEKRDIGILKAKGELIAFLDDDSYPDKNWLVNAVRVKEKHNQVAVCGPGLTPPNDTFAQKLTGAVLGSTFGSGPYVYRFIKANSRFVDDYPAYNLIVSKKILLKVGGFGTKYYGGEDTALCLKLLNSGNKIFYHPSIVVYHHRRKFPFGYVKQVGNVGLHRGYFVKKYPKTSLRISYFGPALFLIMSVFLSFYSIYNDNIRFLSLVSFLLFYGVVLISNARKNALLINIFLPFAIVINYYAYGLNFLKGLLLENELLR